MNARQTAFVAAYLGESHGVAVNAAERAGYVGTRHSLETVASRLLRNVEIASAIAAANARLVEEGIGNREHRVRAQLERWQKLQQVIADRAASYAGRIAGAETGLLVRTYKRDGEELREEWRLDTGLLAELRALEQHSAKELGQWSERAELSGPNGGELVIRRFIGVDVDQV